MAALPSGCARAARFSLATGLNQSNVLGLTWGGVAIDRCTAWIPAGQTRHRHAAQH